MPLRRKKSFSPSDGAMRRSPDAVLSMHPSDASVRGVRDGDDVLVFNDIGSTPMSVAQMGALQAAGAYWSSQLADPVTVYLDVQFADEAVCIGPPASKDSYLNIRALMAAAEVTGCDAVHPGYGFLSENPAFAEIVEKVGMKFIGPRSEMLRLMGNKVQARNFAEEAGLPLLPGARGVLRDGDEAETAAFDPASWMACSRVAIRSSRIGCP